MNLRTHLIVVITIIVLTFIVREVVYDYTCSHQLAEYCHIGQKLTDLFLIIYGIGLVITLTTYFFIGLSKAWSYLKTYLYAILTYIITIPIYFFLFTFLVPLMFKTTIIIQ